MLRLTESDIYNLCLLEEKSSAVEVQDATGNAGKKPQESASAKKTPVIVDVSKETPNGKNDNLHDSTSESSFHPTSNDSAEDSDADEQPVLKKMRPDPIKDLGTSSSKKRSRCNLHIPPKFHPQWVLAQGRNGRTPTIRTSGKYMYGIGAAIGQAGLSWTDFGKLYGWVKINVKHSSWMGQLRRAGLGDELKVKDELKKRNDKLASIFRGWVTAHNKYNKCKIVCHEVEVIEIAGFQKGFQSGFHESFHWGVHRVSM